VNHDEPSCIRWYLRRIVLTTAVRALRFRLIELVGQGRLQSTAVIAKQSSVSADSANLDLLRAVAVSYVFVFHLLLFAHGLPQLAVPGYKYWVHLGHLGVLMFFVHTSFVLMRSLERLEQRSHGESLFLAFMIRRCFRLLPLSILTVMVIVVFRLPVGHLQSGVFWPVPMRPRDIIANLLLIQNVVGSESLEAPLWSLPFEVQMYLLLPAIYRWVCKDRPASAILALWAVTFIFGLMWQRHPVFEMPGYVPCFLAGVVSFKLASKPGRWGTALWPLALLAATCLYLRSGSHWAAWCGCLALGLSYPYLAEMPENWIRRLCKYIARYSYGIYLSHFPLIWFAFVKLSGLPLPWRIFIFVVATVCLPVLLFHFVEQPMIRVGAKVVEQLRPKLKPMKLTSVVAGALLLSFCVFALRARAAHPNYELGLSYRAGNPDQRVRLIGRFDLRDPSGPRCAWPGSAVRVTFEGTALDMVLNDMGSNYVVVSIDSLPAKNFALISGTHLYPLASNLKRGVHSVTVTKRTEAMVGVMQYLGVKVHDGQLVAGTTGFVHHIEYIGDSIACGYGVLGRDASCNFSPSTEDVTRSYAMLTAHALSAEPVILAYAGKGMYRDYLGSTSDQMPSLFWRSLPDDPSSNGAFESVQPEVVVVDLSTNDFYQGDPGLAFRRSYLGFLRELRARHPQALFVCLMNSMLGRSGTGGRAAAATAIGAAVKTLNASGDTRVVYLELDEQDPIDGYGCESHPSQKTHRQMAAKLTDFVRKAMHW